MPEKRPIEMRRREDAARVRTRLIAVASVVGVLALVIGVAAILIGTFPHPAGSSATSPTGTRSTASPANARAVAAREGVKASATASSTKAPDKTEATPAKNPALKPAKKAAPKTKAAPPPTPPLGMVRTLSGSKQMIVATGSKLGATHGTLRIFNLVGNEWKQVFSAPCRFGTNGLIDGTKRKEGSRTTPTGIWWPGTWVWGWHKTAPAGTLMPYRQTTQDVWWSDERNSTYNTWVVSSHKVSGERLVDVRVQYEFALSTGYNASPNQVVQGRGTAIFLHVFDPPDFHAGLSAGCVTLSRANMIRVFQTMDPARKPSFAVGTEVAGTPTSIASY